MERHICSYFNTGSLSELRTHQIVRELDQKQVSVAMLQGTRNSFVGERLIGNYKLFYEGSGTSNVDMHAGVIVVIHSKLLHGSKVTKIPACSHRALMIRVKAEYIDVTFVSGHAPGDHLPRKIRQEFWKPLAAAIRQLPKRTAILVGIDANGHIGRDGTGTVGQAGAERWTENGQSLNDLSERCGISVMNTMTNCLEPGWTWKRADGGGMGRIDYLLLSTGRMGQVKSNKEAFQWEEIDREGAPTDHRPVGMKCCFKLHDECQRSSEQRSHTGHQMSQFNEVLSRAFAAVRTNHYNQSTLKQSPVDLEHLDIAEQMVRSFQEDVDQSWRGRCGHKGRKTGTGCNKCLQ